MRPPMPTRPDPQEGRRRGWIVVATTFVSLGLVYGIWYSYSVFLVAFLREFGWSRSLVAGAFSLFVLVHGCFSPISGWLGGRVGPRRLILAGGCALGGGLILTAQATRWWHLYLSFGVLTAAGVGASGWVASVVLVRGWFPDRIGTALGVASAGIGVGIFGLIPLAQFLINGVGWRWAYRILAGLIVAWILPAASLLVRDPPAGAGGRPGRTSVDGGMSWTLALAVRDWHFWGLAAVFYLGNVGTQMLLVHQVAYLVDHGVSLAAAAAVGGLVGLVSIPGKMGWGLLSDRTNRELAYTLAFACLVVSLGVLVLAGRYPASGLAYLYAVLVALGYSATAPLTPAAASDLFSGPRFSTIFGTLHLGNSLGAATGPWVAGKIFDATGSYAAALWLALVTAIASAALLWVVAPRRPHLPPGRQASPIGEAP
jgi:MFS family permease